MALHHAVTGEVIRLHSVSDPAAVTMALMKTTSFETIHLVVRAGETIPEHKVSGSISLYCVEGAAVIETAGGERPLAVGDWLFLDPGAPHAVRGVVDAGLILTILFDQPILHLHPSQR